MATSVQQTLNGRTPDIQEDQVIRCVVIAYTVIDVACSGQLVHVALWCQLAHGCIDAHARHWPRAQILNFVSVAMLHMCISFIRQLHRGFPLTPISCMLLFNQYFCVSYMYGICCILRHCFHMAMFTLYLKYRYYYASFTTSCYVYTRCCDLL